RGLALLLISHDFGVVAEVCDRVAVMKNGVIVEQGETEAVLRDPQHDYTRQLIACVPEPGDGRAFLERVRPLFAAGRAWAKPQSGSRTSPRPSAAAARCLAHGLPPSRR